MDTTMISLMLESIQQADDISLYLGYIQQPMKVKIDWMQPGARINNSDKWTHEKLIDAHGGPIVIGPGLEVSAPVYKCRWGKVTTSQTIKGTTDVFAPGSAMNVNGRYDTVWQKDNGQWVLAEMKLTARLSQPVTVAV